MTENVETTCANCGFAAARSYCPECGQATRSPRVPLRELAVELFSSLFSLDSRVFKSLPKLFFRPGHLTRDFLAGHRASQVPPLRMYLLVSLVFFLFFQHPAPNASRTEVWVDDVQVGETSSSGTFKSGIQILSFKSPWQRKHLRPLVADKIEQLRQMDPQVLLDAVFERVEDAIPAALFLFLPLLAGAIKILFWRRGGLYFDHLIFALHFQTFLFLALTSAYLFRMTPYFVYAMAAVLVVAPVYLAMALRTVWRQKWRWIVPKTAVLFFAYLFLAAVVYAHVVTYAAVTI